MFRTITRLLFGGEEESPDDQLKSGEVLEEGWLVVSHQEADSAELKTAEEPTQPSYFALNAETVPKLDPDTRAVDPDIAGPSSSRTTNNSQTISALVSQPKALEEVTQVTCIQKAKFWTNRHYTSRNAIERQNRTRQGVVHPTFHLQQPGHRSISH
ncbi:uncharacterized protein ACBR49_018430 [Aulostomus maculatus]